MTADTREPNGVGIGTHCLIDLHGVAAEALQNNKLIQQTLFDCVTLVGATPIFSRFHQFGGAAGITGVILLQESHISIHTWPEYGYAAVDVFMCGAIEIDAIASTLSRAFSPSQVRTQMLARGQLEHVTT